MKLKELLEDLKQKDCYKEFKEKYPSSFFTAGLFMLSREEKEGDKLQLDFFIPEKKNIVSFEYPFNSYKIHEDPIEKSKPIEDFNLKADILDLKEITKKEIGREFSKIIAVLQDGEWNTTCLDGLSIKRIRINAYTGEVISAGNLDMNDIMRFSKK
jgi:hypothetical protein